jgi:hypothetical protein
VKCENLKIKLTSSEGEDMKLTVTTRKMFLVIGISALALMGAGAAYYRSFGAVPFAAGVLLTSILSIIKIIMLDNAINKILSMNDTEAGKNYLRAQYFLRFLLTGLVLAIAAISPPTIISLWGAGAGLLTYQAATISLKFMKIEDNPYARLNKMDINPESSPGSPVLAKCEKEGGGYGF